MAENPPTVADHELICLIGKGSYGEVWLARSCTGRFRAVKIVFRDRFKNSNPYDRELSGIRQYEPISRSYEGFIDVLQVGEDKDKKYFYYVMEAADDLETGAEIDPAHYRPHTLADEMARRGRIGTERCIQFGIGLSRALSHLHDHQLVHRDIKPANIIFVNGSIKLADIGLVTSFSNAASYVGTEGFIPPDGPGTEQADIFGLGKVLYEAASGLDRQKFPTLPAPLPDAAQESEFQELNEVILKACHPIPKNRYRNGREMLRDLAALEGGQSVRRLRLLERRFQFLRRAALAFTAVSLVAAAIFLPAYHARKLLNATRQEQRGALLANAMHDLNAGNLLASLPKYTAALRIDAGDPPREQAHRLRLHSILAQCPKITDMEFLGGEITCVGMSPDGKSVLAGQRGECVYVYNLEGPRNLRKLPVPSLTFATFSPDGKCIATAGLNHLAIIWDAETFAKVLEIQHPALLESARYSADGLRLVTAGGDGIARIWDARTGQILTACERLGGKLMYAEFNPAGTEIVTASADGSAQIWEAATGAKMGPRLPHNSWVMYATFSADGKRLATTSYDKKAIVWEAPGGRQLSVPMDHADSVSAAAFSPDGAFVATAGLDGFLRIWNGYTGQPLKVNGILKHSSRVEHLAYSADSRRLVTGCLDGSVRVWDFAHADIESREMEGFFSGDGTVRGLIEGRAIRLFGVGEERAFPAIECPAQVKAAALNDNAQFLLALFSEEGQANTIGVWNTASGARLAPPIPVGSEQTLANVTLSRNGNLLAIAQSNRLDLVDVATANATPLPRAPGDAVSLVSFDPAGTKMAATAGNAMTLWKLGPKISTVLATNFPAVVSVLQFSDDGRQLLTACMDASYQPQGAQIIDSETGALVSAPMRHRDGVRCGVFSTSGEYVATGGEDFSAMVWQAGRPQPLAILPHSEQVRLVCFNSDASLLLTWSRDERLRFWNPLTGELLSPPIRQEGSNLRAAFLPKANSFVVMGKDKGWQWAPKTDPRPLEDLELLAQLLASDWPLTASLSNEHIRNAWLKLSQKYPTSFHSTRNDVLKWHQARADASNEANDAQAALFHRRVMQEIVSGP